MSNVGILGSGLVGQVLASGHGFSITGAAAFGGVFFVIGLLLKKIHNDLRFIDAKAPSVKRDTQKAGRLFVYCPVCWRHEFNSYHL